MHNTGDMTFLVPRHVKSCHRRCAIGSRYPHRCQYSIYICSFLIFLIVVYRLSHWHASFHTHTHFGFTWFIVPAMQKLRPCHSGCAIGIVKNGLPKSNHVIVAVPLGLSKQFVKTSLCNSRCTKLGLSKKFVKRSLCNGRCTIGIRDAETFNKGYMTRTVPLGLPKKVAKRSLRNSRCAIGIPDAENFEKRYMAHAVPLVLVANL